MPPKDYQPPTLTIECVLFQIIDGRLSILVGKVAGDLFHGQWALPGSFCKRGETTIQALERIMDFKAGVDIHGLGLIEQLHTFDTIAPDARGHVIDIVYLAAGHDVSLNPDNTVIKASTPCFEPVAELPPLAYGHRSFVDYALLRLQSQLRTTTAASALLPELFTLSQLQAVYEIVLGKEMNKRNFRVKFLSYDVLEATDTYTTGAHRPAQYYRFKQKGVYDLVSSF